MKIHERMEKGKGNKEPSYSSTHLCFSELGSIKQRHGDTATGGQEVPGPPSAALSVETAKGRDGGAASAPPRVGAGPRKPASPVPSSSQHHRTAMPGRLLRGLWQRWRRYKYRFVPWIALNLSHNPR